MIAENADRLNPQAILENITHTLLYEGYALFPYHRSAIKNQKPVPFGVVFPQHYNAYNEFGHSKMQTQCIVKGNDDLQVNITVRFLHLKKTERLERPIHKDTNFASPGKLSVKGKSYEAGWQTIERTISTGDLQISRLIKKTQIILIEFDKTFESKTISDESAGVDIMQIDSMSEITGSVIIDAAHVENMSNAFRITVRVINTTPVENAGSVTRDEALSQSFLSTHIILQNANGEFVSHQSPPQEWRVAIAGCQNLNTWPILIDENDTTLLSSPIILYDYPQINPQSSVDLFDSTEIEEALLLHVGVLSDEEKKRIAQSDEKLQAMLSKVSQITPEELINFHSGLKESSQNQMNHKKNAE